MTELTLHEQATLALGQCICTRGQCKGSFLKRAPASNTLAYAAWMGAMLSINPYKASVAGLMFMSAEQRAVADLVTAAFDAHPEFRGMDRDRRALEALGVW